ncbi:MAG: hypothetical protein RIR18_663 [Pseudomonadota bacterium]|jgi:hypothetical protein
MEKSKTQQAIELVDAGIKPFAAAKQVELSPNALYLALKKRREQQQMAKCPCCGSVVPEKQIKRDLASEIAEGFNALADERIGK